MRLEVTRDVVSDLYPLYRSGEASRDSRVLVEGFLAGDGEFAATLRETERLAPGFTAPRLSPDAELRLLEAAQQRARTKLMIIAGAVGVASVLLLGALCGVLVLMLRG